MPVTISSDQRTDAISVPYPSFFSDTRSNRGFIDVRGRPDSAAKIAESLASSNLRSFLVRLASSQSSLFSIGCDLGNHVDGVAPKGRRSCAGGYIHVTSVRYNQVMPEHWARLCNSVSETLRQSVSQRDEWDVKFTLGPIMMNLDRYHKLTGGVEIAFLVWDKTHHGALRSRERLIAAIDDGLSDEAIRSAFDMTL